jgi:hypothetical protein
MTRCGLNPIACRSRGWGRRVQPRWRPPCQEEPTANREDVPSPTPRRLFGSLGSRAAPPFHPRRSRTSGRQPSLKRPSERWRSRTSLLRPSTSAQPHRAPSAVSSRLKVATHPASRAAALSRRQPPRSATHASRGSQQPTERSQDQPAAPPPTRPCLIGPRVRLVHG